MKAITTSASVLALVALVSFAPWRVDSAIDADTSAALELTRYAEFRSTTLWAGACHFNAEADHQGREALIGLEFMGSNGETVQALAAIESSANFLDGFQAGVERRAEVWLDTHADGDLSIAAIERLLGSELGEIVAVHRADVHMAANADRFSIDVEGVLQASAELMPDRECCTMTEQRWYEPLAAPVGAPVGRVETCRFEGGEMLGAWTYEDANSAFWIEF